MRILSLLLLLLSSTQALAFQWATSKHHDKAQIQKDPSPTKYISAEPKSENWRKFYQLPKLLTANFYKVQDVCADAKKENAARGLNKEYALVAHKSHFCDVGFRACLSTLKTISDPCNSYIHNNYHVYHSRTFVGSFKPSGSKEIMDTYGQMGPSLLVIRLKDCELIPTVKGSAEISMGMSADKAAAENYFYTGPSMDEAKDEAGENAFRSEDERVRFHAMKDSLVKNIPELAKVDSKRMDCFENGKRTLPGISDMEDIKYGKITIKGILGLRKLMDEQLIQVTGQNPYKP